MPDFRIIVVLFILTGIILFSCEDPVKKEDSYEIKSPAWLGQPPEPADNEATSSRVILGKALFFEKALSRDSTISCASCHLPERAFSDDEALSTGIEGRKTMRNAPALFNLAWHPLFFADGGAPTLELQVLAPISDPNEMDLGISEAVNRLGENENYRWLFGKAFKSEPNVFGITRALAAYQRSLISANSRFDRFYYQAETLALSSSMRRGWDLFRSDSLNCISCHMPPHFSSFAFENNGLTSHSTDPGRFRISGDPDERHHFKIPSLRNVAYTSPYMHDGSYGSLSEVIDAYSSGGSGETGQSPLINSFILSSQDKKALLDFFESLTDLEIGD